MPVWWSRDPGPHRCGPVCESLYLLVEIMAKQITPVEVPAQIVHDLIQLVYDVVVMDDRGQVVTVDRFGPQQLGHLRWQGLALLLVLVQQDVEERHLEVAQQVSHDLADAFEVVVDQQDGLRAAGRGVVVRLLFFRFHLK